MFGGRTLLTAREGGLAGSRYAGAPLDHPNIGAAKTSWRWAGGAPPVRRAAARGQPFVDVTLTPEQWQLNHGYSSDGFRFPFGVVAATVDNAYGFAQALVHETAHHKLRALGVQQPPRNA